MFRPFRFLSIVAMMGLPMLAQAAAPVVNSMWPASARKGEQVRVNGSGFGTSAAGKRVFLRDRSSAPREMSIVAWNNSVIAVRVPADAVLGAGSVYLTYPTGSGTAVSNSAPFTVTMAPIPEKGTLLPHPITPAPTVRAKLPVIVAKPCPDPAAYRIDFNLQPRHTQFTGRVSITGVVKNLGGAYESRPNQQQLSLYEGSRQVATLPFGNLAPGQEVSVNYQRDWNVSTEFPPTYKLMISYDPDIRLDNNKQNDDCNNGNNTKTRSGVEINRLF